MTHGDEMIRFGHIEVLATNLERSQQFYRGLLGFEISAVQGDRFVWLRNGPVEILLRQGRPPQPTSRYEDARVGIVLYTESLDEVMDELEGRGLQFRGTVDSDRCPTFTDPDGNWFQLVDPDDH
jgi:catechol 2,3-dioxygenase-like lactoylglutathione lyase family enzyme